MNKIKVWQDTDISLFGVGKVWRWNCPECLPDMNYYFEALYWVNAIRSVNQHINHHVSVSGSR